MEEEDLLVSKIECEEIVDNEDYEKEKIRERNNFYQSLISKHNPPIALNSSCLRKLTSKEVFEKQVLNKGTHLSTLIPEYKINRQFIFFLLKNYKLFDITEEESRFLLNKYFTDSIEANPVEEEIIDLKEPIIQEVDEELEKVDEDIEDESEEESSIEEEEETEIEENKIIEEKKYEVKKNSLNKDPSPNKEPDIIQSTMRISSIPSMPTDNFITKKKKLLVKNNMNQEKIEETKEMKRNISLFLKNALEKRSGIDKKTTIIQFLYKNNFKGNFNASFFDIKDEEGELICGEDIIDEWYDAIEQIEEKQKAAFECSQLIITICLYGVEFLAKKFSINELSTICSEVRDPANLPKHLESTKRSLSNIIDNNIPNNFLIDLIFFIGNVYIKNRAGISL